MTTHISLQQPVDQAPLIKLKVAPNTFGSFYLEVVENRYIMLNVNGLTLVVLGEKS